MKCTTLSDKSLVPEVTKLLNKYLSFGIATEDKILSEINSINYLSLVSFNDEGVLNGYICARKINAPLGNILIELGYDTRDFKFFHLHGVKQGYLLITKAVVIPEERDTGVLTNLMKELVIQASKQGFSKGFAAQVWLDKSKTVGRITNTFDYQMVVPNYYTPYNLPCPDCVGKCTCSVLLGVKSFEYVKRHTNSL